MPTFAQSHIRWLDPPEEPEAVFCDDCGEEMTDDGYGTLVCYYQFCPSKFDGDAKELAYNLVGAREEVKSMARKLRRLQPTA